jgi:hypothetical protein
LYSGESVDIRAQPGNTVPAPGYRAQNFLLGRRLAAMKTTAETIALSLASALGRLGRGPKSATATSGDLRHLVSVNSMWPVCLLGRIQSL